jgi:hypothetical protein
MYAMQYEIALPADYDMGIIRARVAARGANLDHFPGLGLKAYLIRERGIDDSPVNQYSPFYLWSSISGMNRFLWGGGGFGAILDAFGRPTVQHWTGVACARGTSDAPLPRYATRSIESIPAHADPVAVVADAQSRLEQRARTPGVHTTAFAIDPKSWELVTFTLWEDAAPQMTGTRYQVLHLCRPHLDEIAASKAT